MGCLTQSELQQSLRSLPTTARQTLDRLLTGRPAPADRFWADPARLLSDAGLAPDPWQAGLLRSAARRVLLLCGRQCGKSTTAAALALKAALLEPPALVLLLSPTLRQSGELFRDKVLTLYDALGRPVSATSRTALTLELANGSRIISLPESEAGIRGYSGVRLLVIDEAARVGEDLYASVRPMLATSKGRLVALSTPFGRRGWFHDAWHGGEAWLRVEARADRCPRIPADFLAEERRALGERWYRQEYECSWEDLAGSLFSSEDIAAAMSEPVPPLFGG